MTLPASLCGEKLESVLHHSDHSDCSLCSHPAVRIHIQAMRT